MIGIAGEPVMRCPSFAESAVIGNRAAPPEKQDLAHMQKRLFVGIIGLQDCTIDRNSMPKQEAVRTLNVDRLRQACSRCSLQDLCLPVGVTAEDLELLDSMVETIGPLHGGDHLFHQGEPFLSLYAVRSGCIKSYIDTENGEEQVLGFHLPGELVGMDAIHRGSHQCSALALDTAMVCRLPFDQLSEMTRRIPNLQKQFFRLMSRDLETSYSLSAHHSVDQRLAAFLLGFGDRMRARGFSSTHFILPMSRQDIASYLRLAPETVSRALSRFASDSLIEISRRDIKVVDREKLEQNCPREFRL
ncbi:MAG TPA: helix-turn-helix domain-containing protein [Gammaproteobacteria bacterium]|nr:helix-turn-helix domain-containing protein [Gammaproteobacteria bacterium]